MHHPPHHHHAGSKSSSTSSLSLILVYLRNRGRKIKKFKRKKKRNSRKCCVRAGAQVPSVTSSPILPFSLERSGDSVWEECACLAPVISGHCVLKHLHDKGAAQDDPSSSQKEHPVMPSFHSHRYHPKPLPEPKGCRRKGRVCSSQQCKRSPHCPTRPRKH